MLTSASSRDTLPLFRQTKTESLLQPHHHRTIFPSDQLRPPIRPSSTSHSLPLFSPAPTDSDHVNGAQRTNHRTKLEQSTHGQLSTIRAAASPTKTEHYQPPHPAADGQQQQFGRATPIDEPNRTSSDLHGHLLLGEDTDAQPRKEESRERVKPWKQEKRKSEGKREWCWAES